MCCVRFFNLQHRISSCICFTDIVRSDDLSVWTALSLTLGLAAGKYCWWRVWSRKLSVARHVLVLQSLRQENCHDFKASLCSVMSLRLVSRTKHECCKLNIHTNASFLCVGMCLCAWAHTDITYIRAQICHIPQDFEHCVSLLYIGLSLKLSEVPMTLRWSRIKVAMIAQARNKL